MHQPEGVQVVAAGSAGVHVAGGLSNLVDAYPRRTRGLVRDDRVPLGGADQAIGELQHQLLRAARRGGVDVDMDAQGAQYVAQSIGVQWQRRAVRPAWLRHG